jgi:hypothetical protein
MNHFFIVILFLSCIFCNTSILLSGVGDIDLDIFLLKLREVTKKGFPYLCDLRYTSDVLKKMIIRDTFWNNQGSFSYKNIAVPSLFCNVEETMEIVLISCNKMPIKINWDIIFSQIKQSKFFSLVIKRCENLTNRGQEMIYDLFSDIPECLKNCIVGIDCSECNLERIPDIIYQFPLLEYCRFENNEIQKIPENFFSSLTKLRWLFVSKNQINIIPSLQHDTIEVVDFSNNNLSVLQFGVLPQLRYLNVKNTEFEGDIVDCFSNAPKLKKIIIPDQNDYAFLEKIDLSKFKIKVSRQCIKITL